MNFENKISPTVENDEKEALTDNNTATDDNKEVADISVSTTLNLASVLNSGKLQLGLIFIILQVRLLIFILNSWLKYNLFLKGIYVCMNKELSLWYISIQIIKLKYYYFKKRKTINLQFNFSSKYLYI